MGFTFPFILNLRMPIVPQFDLNRINHLPRLGFFSFDPKLHGLIAQVPYEAGNEVFGDVFNLPTKTHPLDTTGINDPKTTDFKFFIHR